MNISFFSKQETKYLFSIFCLLILIIFVNLRVSARKGRDNIRKNDATAIQGQLEKYLEKYKVFPESQDGKIVACFTDDTYFDDKLERYVNLRPCEWGQDGFEDLEKLPKDPYYDKGRGYLYISNTRRFQLFVSLEGKSESEYTESVAKRGLNCGNAICNFGKSYGGVPLGVSLEEYEESQK